MSSRHFDVIVLGLGGIGSVAAYDAASRGLNVLGLEQYAPAHSLGSSHGQTRAIRKAYFEHADYVPLLEDAYAGWDKIEQVTGRHLFERVGILQVGPPDGEVCGGILRSAEQHNLPIDVLQPAECRSRYPQLNIADNELAVFERDAGFLYVERAVQTYLDQAKHLGAHLRFNEPVRTWSCSESNSGPVSLTTDSGTYEADRLIVATGSWAARQLPHLQEHLTVVRKHLHWFTNANVTGTRATSSEDPYALGQFSVFFFETLGGFFYGFPAVDRDGLKVAEHSGGTPIDRPEADNRQPEEADDRRVIEFLAERFPLGEFCRSRHAVCFYTVSTDHHFILERDPRFGQIAYVAGLSGHGYKFAPALGRALVDLAIEGASELPIDFLSSRRLK